MPKVWTDIRQWIAEEDALIKQGFDSITVFTGEEGTGKSYAMLAKHRLSDRTFNEDRVHFEQDPFMAQCVALQPGRAIQLDEFDGHRRLAMHGGRMEFLKFLKERRSLRLRMGIGFPHISQLDRDILRSRVRYRAHLPSRGVLEVKCRQVVREEVDRQGNPTNVIRWPLRGRFPIPDISSFPLVKAYDARKESFTRRNPTALEVEAGQQPHTLFKNLPAARAVVQEILASL